MKHFIVIPDSFKGTMQSVEICAIMRERIVHHIPEAVVHIVPVADGGEGSVDCFLAALGGQKRYVQVSDPFFEECSAYYGELPDGSGAVIEMAACAGLPLAEGRLDPLRTTTYGVGELMLAAVRSGAKKLIVGLGGSATNDGGCGAAAALGVRFYNAQEQTFVPTGGTLKDIARIDTSGLYPAIAATEIIAMCDIDNPMYGSQGAAHVFAPQKGASVEMVKELDAGLMHLAQAMKRDLGCDVAQVPGAGAAGALGAGMLAFCNAKLQMGIEAVLDVVRFDDMLQNTDMVFTGEGKIDGQSLRGKVVIGVARRARKQGVPVCAVVGMIGEGIEEAYTQGVTAIFSINPAPVPYEEARHRSKENLKASMDNLMRLCCAIKR